MSIKCELYNDVVSGSKIGEVFVFYFLKLKYTQMFIPQKGNSVVSFKDNFKFPA